MATAITYNWPGFIADVLEINGDALCVVSPTVATDASDRALVRRFMQGQGLDCGECRGCPVGTGDPYDGSEAKSG